MVRTNYKKSKTKEHILSEKQIQRVINAIEYEDELILFYCLLYTGLRVSEFIHLRRSWIDWENDFIRIPKKQKCSCSECKKNGGFWSPKTSTSVRVIPIVSEIRGILERYFSEHNSIMELIPSRGMAYYILRDLGKKARVKLFPHALRGTFATILASKDFNPFEICDAMGWKSIQTAIYYIRLSGAQLKRAFEQKW